MNAILFFFHNESNSGFASSRHEKVFSDVGLNITSNYSNIHFAYKSLQNGRPSNVPFQIKNIIESDYRTRSFKQLFWIYRYVKANKIKIVFGFDFPVNLKIYLFLKLGGVKTIVSYFGAPMSDINFGIKLFLKRISVFFTIFKPDAFIFQSYGMKNTAVYGRGIPKCKTCVVYSGTDINLYKPSDVKSEYAYDQFYIEKSKTIVFFSGNMEKRKGVDVIVKTADFIVSNFKRFDIHFLLVGNRWNQEQRLISLLQNKETANHITFGGYRTDVPLLLQSCSIGMIASNGWDSYPMSSLEMQSCGLPLVVSDIPGLRECVTPDTGFLFRANDYKSAASKIMFLVDNACVRNSMGKAARERVVKNYTMDHQVNNLEKAIRHAANL